MGQRSSSSAVKPSSSTKDNPQTAPMFALEWTIKNIGDRDHPLIRGPFSHPDDLTKRFSYPPEWSLELYPYGLDRKSQHISMFLRLKSGSKVTAKFKLTLTNAERKIIKELEATNDFVPGYSPASDWGWREFTPRDELLSQLQPEGDLTVRCEVVVLDKCGFNQLSVPDSILSRDLAQMLHTPKYADCVIEVGGREIRAHKDVLSARSPVFAAMFEHETRESVAGRVLVADVEFPVMEELVHFIYTGNAPNLSAISERLIVAADKYQLERLKLMCEFYLWKNMNADNVCESLVLADLHSATQLKDKTIKFINSNANQVTQTHGWEKMNLEQPHLLTEILKAKDSSVDQNVL